jgi:actin-related protein
MTRAGYAGEDTPRVMFPTSIGYVDTVSEDVVMTEQGEEAQAPQSKRQYYIGDNKINKFKSNMEVKNPMKDGMGELFVCHDYMN